MAAIALLVVVLGVFQPQRLQYDNVVDEDFPLVEPTTDDATATDDDADAATTDDARAPDAAEDGPTGADVATDENGEGAPETGDTEADGAEMGAEPEPTGPVALTSGDFISRSRYTVTGGATRLRARGRVPHPAPKELRVDQRSEPVRVPDLGGCRRLGRRPRRRLDRSGGVARQPSETRTTTSPPTWTWRSTTPW